MAKDLKPEHHELQYVIDDLTIKDILADVSNPG